MSRGLGDVYKRQADENVGVSLTFGVNGSGKRGDVTVTAQQQEVAAYAFKDTTQES